MSGAKRFGIAVIIGLCTAVAFSVFHHWNTGKTVQDHSPGQIVEHSTEQKPSDSTPNIVEPKKIVLQQDVLLTAIQDACKNQLEIHSLSVDIEENACVSLSGSVGKTDVASLLEKQTDSISSAYAAILDLLPDQLPVKLTIRMQVTDGYVTILPLHFSIASMEIPDTCMKGTLFEGVEKTINRELLKQITHIKSISSTDGTLVITGE